MDRNCWLLQSTDGSMDDKDMEVYSPASQKSFELCQPPEAVFQGIPKALWRQCGGLVTAEVADQQLLEEQAITSVQPRHGSQGQLLCSPDHQLEPQTIPRTHISAHAVEDA